MYFIFKWVLKSISLTEPPNSRRLAPNYENKYLLIIFCYQLFCLLSALQFANKGITASLCKFNKDSLWSWDHCSAWFCQTRTTRKIDDSTKSSNQEKNEERKFVQKNLSVKTYVKWFDYKLDFIFFLNFIICFFIVKPNDTTIFELILKRKYDLI